MEIPIESRVTSLGYLKRQLDPLIGEGLLRMDSAGQDRDANPAVLIALIGAAGSTVTALVTGILALRGASKAQRILIESDGTRIEVPVNAPPERVRELLTTVKDASVRRIILDR